MYDLHAHILPAVDDGARTMEETLAMTVVAAEQGTKMLLATPHRKDVTEQSSVAHIQSLVGEVNAWLGEREYDLTMVLGMENHLDLDLPDEIEAGRALPMNGTEYILVEMPFFGRPNWVQEVLFQIQLQGLKPVLAHPERIEAFQRDPDMLAMFVDRGILTQVTAGSPVGHFGRRVQRITRDMLDRNLVHILASDTHNPSGPRSPKLRRGVEAVAKIVGEEAAKRMVVDTPKAILEGKTVEIEPSRKPTSSGSWWRFW
jgi:protein-tyrosine phosphatase